MASQSVLQKSLTESSINLKNIRFTIELKMKNGPNVSVFSTVASNSNHIPLLIYHAVSNAKNVNETTNSGIHTAFSDTDVFIDFLHCDSMMRIPMDRYL